MKKTGFTLIEILVVLGVIGLLAMILIPAVSAGMAKARRAQCLNNLKSIGASTIAFSADNRGRMPRIGSSDADFDSLTDMVKAFYEDGYLETPETWVCPTDSGRTPCRPDGDGKLESFQSKANCSYIYFQGYNPIKVDSVNTLPLFCDRARGGVKAPLTDADNHGARYRNVVYLGGAAVTLRTAEEANEVVSMTLPENVGPVE